VARVVDRAIAAYAPGIEFAEIDAPLVESSEEGRPQDMLRAADLAVSQGDFQKGAHYLSLFLDRHGERTKLISAADLRLKYATCLLKSGLNQAGLLQTMLAARATDATAAVLLKCALRMIGSDPAAARQMTDDAEARGGPASEIAWMRARIALASGEQAEGAAMLQAVLKMDNLPDSTRKGVLEMLQSVAPAAAAE
jgi:hypothetical protein